MSATSPILACAVAAAACGVAIAPVAAADWVQDLVDRGFAQAVGLANNSFYLRTHASHNNCESVTVTGSTTGHYVPPTGATFTYLGGIQYHDCPTKLNSMDWHYELRSVERTWQNGGVEECSKFLDKDTWSDEPLWDDSVYFEVDTVCSFYCDNDYVVHHFMEIDVDRTGIDADTARSIHPHGCQPSGDPTPNGQCPTDPTILIQDVEIEGEVEPYINAVWETYELLWAAATECPE